MTPITHCPDPQAWIARLDLHSRPGPNGCILWTGTTDARSSPGRGSGYGKFRMRINGKSRMTGAHRAAWLARRGDIPDDLTIDHLCRVPACVNVEHMELVTLAENVRRAKAAVGILPDSARHCRRHGREDGKVAVHTNGYKIWRCYICNRAALAKHLAKKAGRVAA